ncbi:ATP-binding protein [Halovenus rubra]|uniref:ATP-binding protein n=2 Tax=Halovenus rubra TaxID=869890 RepID=A0ACC7E0W8_9EURY|nr:ATP-binding protein [Halovenus rubra]
MSPSLGIVGQVYISIFALSGIVCFAAIRRAQKFDNPDVRRGLVWLLATAGSWALLKSAYFVLPSPFERVSYIIGLAVGFATVWAWLYFCSAYTGQDYHRNKSLRQLSAAVFLVVVSVKVTNWIHGLYFTTTETTTPFEYLAIEHGLLHWAATGLAYSLSMIGLFMLFQLFQESGYDTRSLGVLTGLIAVPVIFDIAALFIPGVIEIIYAPIGVAAFAVGVLFVFERRFLAIQRTARGDDISIYLDESGSIRDYSSATAEILPEVVGATGNRLDDVLPAVTDALDSENQILDCENSGKQRFYFVSSSTVKLGDVGAQVVQLSDVTKTESQRQELVEREQKLNEQNELYRAVIDASFASVFRLDLDGMFTFISPSVEDFLGYTPVELEGQQMSVTHPDEEITERAWNQIEPILRGESNRVHGFPLETKSGRTVYTDVRGVPIYNAEVSVEKRTPDDIVGIQLMVRDATARRQREGLISVINRVLRHNLRNKMSIITSYAEMLEAKLEEDDEDKATHIRDTADRLLDLTESAQKIEENRELSPELEPINLRPMLDRTISQVEMQYPDVSVTVTGPETVVAQTHKRLETALSEIIDNAAKHGDTPPSVDIEMRVDGTQIAVAISDNGPGISEMERDVLESNTETQLVHGEGLGLWLVFWIVTSLDGEVDAAVSPEGTTVTIWLPKPS